MENADAAFDKVVAAGATPVFPVSDQFYGSRCGRILDPSGHEWIVQHVFEQVSRRWASAYLADSWTSSSENCAGDDGNGVDRLGLGCVDGPWKFAADDDENFVVTAQSAEAGEGRE